jgi:hypothetical protein
MVSYIIERIDYDLWKELYVVDEPEEGYNHETDDQLQSDIREIVKRYLK